MREESGCIVEVGDGEDAAEGMRDGVFEVWGRFTDIAQEGGGRGSGCGGISLKRLGKT